jgi:hypothetical protein
MARQITVKHTIDVHADFIRASVAGSKNVDCTLIAKPAKAKRMAGKTKS